MTPTGAAILAPGQFENSTGGGGVITETPPGLYGIPVGKGCVLLLTVSEYARALARGKAYRRGLALKARLAPENPGTVWAQ